MNDNQRLVIYTVLLGDKEGLGQPLSLIGQDAETDLKLEFICITDNRELVSDTWKFIYIDTLYLPPERLSRRPKILAHEYFPDWKYSLYIDNVVTFKRLPTSQDLQTTQAYLFKMYLHAFRQNLFQEADAIVSLAYDDASIIDAQLDYYKRLIDIEAIKPVHTCTVMFREHNHPDIIKQAIVWWESFLCYSKRDQMSFDFSVKISACHIEELPGFKHENDFINGIDNAHDNRIRANFDTVKYAWVNRDKPEAIANPGQHFLADPQAQGDSYSKKSGLFEHVCYLCQSSLGAFYAPRHQVADYITDILSEFRGQQGRCLIIRLADEGNPKEFTEQEFLPAAQAFSMFLNPYSINTFELSLKDLYDKSLVFNRIEEQFDTVIVLGGRPEDLPLIVGKFSGLMSKDKARIILLCSGSCLFNQINAAVQYVQTNINANSGLSIYQSSHDSESRYLRNSLLCFEWS